MLKITTGIAAAMICPRSLTFGRRETTSSATPTMIRNVAPAMMPTISYVKPIVVIAETMKPA